MATDNMWAVVGVDTTMGRKYRTFAPLERLPDDCVIAAWCPNETAAINVMESLRIVTDNMNHIDKQVAANAALGQRETSAYVSEVKMGSRPVEKWYVVRSPGRPFSAFQGPVVNPEACICMCYEQVYAETIVDALNESIRFANERVAEDSLRKNDPWAHRSAKMRCATCMWFVPKVTVHKTSSVGPTEMGAEIHDARTITNVGRCRRHAPTMSGYPVVMVDDWCGDHKLDEEKAT